MSDEGSKETGLQTTAKPVVKALQGDLLAGERSEVIGPDGKPVKVPYRVDSQVQVEVKDEKLSSPPKQITSEGKTS
ncbi:MAG: hypothetical protein Q7S31_02355 [bacterium]|nr:hypothetical protein [bacterium]